MQSKILNTHRSTLPPQKKPPNVGHTVSMTAQTHTSRIALALSEKFNNLKNEFLENARLVKRRERLIEKVELQNEFLHISSDPTKFQSGLKHPRLGNNILEPLDELFTRCQTDGQQSFINLQRGTTCREAKNIVVCEMQKFLNLVDEEVARKILEEIDFLPTKKTLLYHSKNTR